ncbi:16326_t:CDS:2, partial [Acaulospora colombiana]
FESLKLTAYDLSIDTDTMCQVSIIVIAGLPKTERNVSISSDQILESSALDEETRLNFPTTSEIHGRV